MLRFTPWRKISAIHDKKAIRNFLDDAADETERAFNDGINSSKSGRVYRKRGRSHRASKAGEFPARDTGKLIGSIQKKIRGIREMQVGTTVPYAVYLRTGTRKMARRKMSDDALREGVPVARRRMKPWARFEIE